MAFLLLLIFLPGSACKPQSATSPEQVISFAGKQDKYSLKVTLTESPAKLKAIPIEVTVTPLDDITELKAIVDMPGMPMHVAPTILKADAAGTYRGDIVFTMSGPWYLEIHAVTADTAWSIRFDDIDVP